MKKRYKVGVAVIIVLVVLGIIGCIGNLIEGKSVLNTAAKLASLLMIVFYAIWGYKKPHGNLLKYLMLFCDVMILFSMNNAMKHEMQAYVIVRVIEVALISYVAGRLNRIDQNKYLMVVIYALSVYCCILSLNHVKSIFGVMRAVTPTIIWAGLCSAYFLRYAQHKEAGLSDK